MKEPLMGLPQGKTSVLAKYILFDFPLLTLLNIDLPLLTLLNIDLPLPTLLNIGAQKKIPLPGSTLQDHSWLF